MLSCILPVIRHKQLEELEQVAGNYYCHSSNWIATFGC